MLLCGEPKTITMKKIYSILLASALTLSSCADFLDVDSQGKLTEDVFFGEEEGALMSINAIYTQLRAWDIIGFSWFAITTSLPSLSLKPPTVIDTFSPSAFAFR